MDQFRQGLGRYFSPGQLQLLSQARVGIAGAGGLGSNAAMLLARSGVENFFIIDHDLIEPSNLNRQHYWPSQIGLPKVDALAWHLRELNGAVNVETRQELIDNVNLPQFLPQAEIWVEAFDHAQIKKIFVEQALLCGCKVASASGVAGFGGEPLKKRRIGNLAIVGDFVTATSVAPPLAPRVTQAAALLADCVLEFILAPLTCNP